MPASYAADCEILHECGTLADDGDTVVPPASQSPNSEMDTHNAAPPACPDGGAMSLGLVTRLSSILAVAVCTALAGCSTGGPDCDHFQFDETAWTSQARTGGDDRTEAFEDLVSCDVLDGMTRAEVKELLGPPQQGRTPQEWTYFLAPGPWDDSHGYVRFSSNGTVTGAFVQDG